MAWQMEQAEKCPGCGMPLDETTDDDRFFDWEPHRIWCNSCQHKHTAERIDAESDSDTSAARWVMSRRQ